MADEIKALETVDIKIATLTKKSMAGQYGQYNLISILDEISGKSGSASGKWTDNWNVGDTIKGQWSLRKYKDKDGNDRASWDIKNPTPPVQKNWGNNNTQRSTIVDAYTVAAMLAPVMFKDAKFKLESFVKLADEIKKNFDKAMPVVAQQIQLPKEDKTPVIQVDKEEKVAVKKVETPKPSAADFDVDGEDDDGDLF